ncbi:MAG: hypothetical protein CBD74_06005 [Saprospirales bacterium TMED214]|nr:MAG: hypothetical protein CBD74_06005 [Saprospirales bacterium TMED214]
MLDQPSGSPDAYQVQQAIQQQAKRDEVDSGMSQAQRIAAVMDMARAGASGEATPENKAKAMMEYAATTIQAMAGSGQGKMALAQTGSADEIARRIYG